MKQEEFYQVEIEDDAGEDAGEGLQGLEEVLVEPLVDTSTARREEAPPAFEDDPESGPPAVDEEGGFVLEEDDDDGRDEPIDATRLLIEEANHRRYFETYLHPLELDARIGRAKTARDQELAAFCFDPDPRVIRSVLENERTGLAHARLMAFHHRSATGLDALASHPTYYADRQVQRLLLRNIHLSEALLKRILSNRRLLDLFKILFDRDNPERTRTAARTSIRPRFMASSADERVAAIFKTEGRVLNYLVGVSFDAKTISMMCAKTYTSTALINNLARYSATPPSVLAHLMRQQLVKRSPQLRNMILRHPNIPGDIKRRGY